MSIQQPILHKNPKESQRIPENAKKSQKMPKYPEKSRKIPKNPEMLPKNLWTMSENRRKSPETLMNPDESRAITIKLLAILPLPCRSRAAPVPLPCRSTARHTHTHKNQNRSLLTKSGNLFHRILRADARGGCSRRMLEADSSTYPPLDGRGGGGD